MNRTGTTTRDRGRRPSDRRGAAPVTALPSRRRARRNSPRRRSLRIAAVLLVLVAVAWVLWAGPLFAVRAVQVDGAGSLPPDQVREAAGIETGTPLLRVDVAAAEKRVARLPQVASVEVTRGWPSSVVITVVERVPIAVVGPAGRRSLVDAEGVLFDSISGDPPAGVVPLDVAHPGPGDPATMAVLTAVRALPADVRKQVSVAAAPSAAAVSLTLADGTVVVWGDASASRTKAAVLAGLLGQFDSGALQPAGTVDVSAPDAVVLR